MGTHILLIICIGVVSRGHGPIVLDNGQTAEEGSQQTSVSEEARRMRKLGAWEGTSFTGS